MEEFNSAKKSLQQAFSNQFEADLKIHAEMILVNTSQLR